MIPDAQGSGAQRSATLSRLTETLILLLIVLGFFLGPLKLLGYSWFSYLSTDALAAIVLLLVAADRISRRKPLLAKSPLTVPVVLLIGYCTLELANPSAPFIRSVLGLRSWLLYLLFYFVGLYTLRSSRQIERLYALLIVLGVVTAAYGVYQWQEGPQSFATWSETYGRYAQIMQSAEGGTLVFRAFSTFVLPNAFGANMALVMLLALSVSVSSTVRVRWRLMAAVAFAIMGMGIAVSGSRGPVAHLMLAGVIGLVFMPGIERRLQLGIIGVSLTAAAIVVIVLVVGSVVGQRFATMFDPNAFFWKWFYPLSNGIQTARNNPFGMGLGYTAGVPSFLGNPSLRGLSTTNVDSGYGSAAAELGFVGLAVFMYFALRVGLEGLRAWSSLRPGRLRDLLLGPALLAATYPVVSVIFQPQAALPSSIYSWLLIGMLMRAPWVDRMIDENQLLRTSVHTGQ